MRVIAGRFRGASLIAPAGHTTRPITDRVKEALFSMLGSRFGTLGELPAFDVLDLFAGSGALGLEALSRGARSCLFVERDRTALRTLRQNVAALKLGPAARIVPENAWTLRLPPSADGYGLIFVDPPYREVEAESRVASLLERTAPRLAADGLLVFRHGVFTPFAPAGIPGLRVLLERRYGKMQLWLLCRPDAPYGAPAEADAADASEGDGAEFDD